MPEATKYILIFAFAAAIGSFLNVCIYRIPLGKSLRTPGSHCTGCGSPIRFYDNVPILSYILLLGRCRRCRQRISFQYPLVEALTVIAAVFLYGKSGPAASSLVYFLFIASLIAITFIDLNHRLIPDVITLPGIAAGLVFSVFLLYPARYAGVIQSLCGIILGGGILFVISALYHLATGQAGMGGGDVKLLAMIGAFLGWKGVVFSLFAGSLAGSMVGVMLMVFWGKKSKYAVPFGPFLSLGAVAYAFYGIELINWYLTGLWQV